MIDPIEDKVQRWDNENPDAYKFMLINKRIIHLNDRLFHDYEPSIGPKSTFFTRLNDWLENLDNVDEQKLLFELVPNLFYIGREELIVLYREAYHTVYGRWLIDTLGITLTEPNIEERLNDAIENTWFCPLTDSLRINQFYHVNDIPGRHDFRPDWRSLVKFGDINKIKQYIDKEGIKQIVLLEDFIGNGGQVSKAVMFAIENLNIPILIIPLIICPAGIENSAALEKENEMIKIRPVLTIHDDYFVNHIEEKNADEFFRKMCILAKSTYKKVSNSEVEGDDIDPYGPFGWKKTGGVIIMHTNTPNNTLPLLHYQSSTWQPLFKRHKRI